MSLLDLQIVLNSSIFVIVMVRFADRMVGSRGRWGLLAFLGVVLMVNMGLMIDRFGLSVASYKALLIAAGFLVGTLFMARVQRGRQE